MKKTILGLGLVIVLAGVGIAQKVDSKSTSDASNAATVSKNSSIASGTQIAAQLQNSLNVEKAKVGDQVVLKTTKAIKQNGQTVVGKGSTLIGRVTEVQEMTKERAMSRVGILFDLLRHNGNEMPITAVITSITQIRSQSRSDDTDSEIYGSSSPRSSTQTSGNSGGLLGGVGNTVGGVVNTTTQTVGGVTNTAGQTLGNATGSLRGIQISQSADASVSGGSTLSLAGDNLRLEKGTTFNLAVSESASVNNK